MLYDGLLHIVLKASLHFPFCFKLRTFARRFHQSDVPYWRNDSIPNILILLLSDSISFDACSSIKNLQVLLSVESRRFDSLVQISGILTPQEDAQKLEDENESKSEQTASPEHVAEPVESGLDDVSSGDVKRGQSQSGHFSAEWR